MQTLQWIPLSIGLAASTQLQQSSLGQQLKSA
jgi:hypothetical protein